MVSNLAEFNLQCQKHTSTSFEGRLLAHGPVHEKERIVK